MDWLGGELDYTNKDDWYNLKGELIRNNYGCGLLNLYNGSPQQLLKALYTESRLPKP